jgi:hypothetical protein
VDECSLPLSLSLSLLFRPYLCTMESAPRVAWLAPILDREREERESRWWKREEWPPRLSPSPSRRPQTAAGQSRSRGTKEGEEGRVVVRCAFFAPDILARIGPLPHAPSLLHTRPLNLPFFSTCTHCLGNLPVVFFFRFRLWRGC